MKFSVFAKEKDKIEPIKGKLMELAPKLGFIYDDINPEVVFVIGGDGSILKASQKYIDKLDSILFAGIKAGTLGFFYDYKDEEIEELLSSILKNDYRINEYNLLEGLLGDKKIYAINEIRLENPFHTMVCQISIDNIELEKFRGNGILVCSSLGSTAYNKSVGGAVMSHNLDTIQLTEISAIQNNVYRSLGSSLILEKNSVITLNGNFDNVLVGYDHLTSEATGLEEIKIYSSNKKIRFLHKKDHTYLNAIKRSFIK